jgi:LysM repeat protein
MYRLRLAVLVLALLSPISVVAAPLDAETVLGQHQVMPGETLYCIGRAYGVAPAAIAQANGLALATRLSIGQVLTIPAVAWANIPAGPVCTPQFAPLSTSGTPEVLAAIPSASASPAMASGITYVIRRGDTLWRIALKLKTTVSALKAANRLTTNIIFPGQQLAIPSTAGLAASSEVTTLTSTASGASEAATSPEPADQTSLPPPTQAPPVLTEPPPAATETPVPLPTEQPTSTTAPNTEVPSATAPPPTAVPTSVPTNTPAPAGNPLNCSVMNIAWATPGQLLRGGRPAADAFACLAAAGVDTLLDQRLPSEDSLNEPALAQQAGLEYINLGIADDTAPSPSVLRAWIDTVNAHLAAGEVVLVHDAAGRGRMGFWDAVYFMLNGANAQSAIEDRYLAKALDFNGAKIGCSDGGNGQVQGLAEIGQILTGVTYFPSIDEYGTAWANCPRPAYMDGWNYADVLP